jgi:hypothetical protein
LDYIAVTVHYKTALGVTINTTLSIIELTNPSHIGKYLTKKLLEVTNRFKITKVVMAVTQDNALTNDIMLNEYESIVNS